MLGGFGSRALVSFVLGMHDASDAHASGTGVGVGVGSAEHMETFIGEGALVVVPSPIWPFELDPQHLTLHSAIQAHE